MDAWIEEFLYFIAEHDLHQDIFWNTDFEFFINCNDFFAWAVCDATAITKDTFPLLQKAIKDADWVCGALLYCARIAKMRPQGAYYKHLDEKYWPLFDACGPKRKTGIGNPEKQPKEK